jgi:hypothetical protein
VIALPLALMAALMSSSGEAGLEIRGFFAAALQPQLVDLGGDPGYLLGMATETVWPLPAASEPVRP